jgi:cytochrome P450
LLHIITIPRVHEKLLAEISGATLSSPISDAEAKKLPYLQAIIKEGLRIYPPVAGLMAKRVPPEGDTINGMFVPGGTQIGYGAWGIFGIRKYGARMHMYFVQSGGLAVGIFESRS